MGEGAATGKIGREETCKREREGEKRAWGRREGGTPPGGKTLDLNVERQRV